MKKLPDIDFLKRRLSIDYENGVLRWNYVPEIGNRFNSRYPGSEAGCRVNNGYRSLRINRTKYIYHRVMWAIANGRDPYPLEVDHIDGDRSNNHPLNLRLATHAQNQVNSASRGKWPRGVCRNPKDNKFTASITRNRKTIYLGRFDSAEEASSAYQKAAMNLFGEYSVHKSRE